MANLESAKKRNRQNKRNRLRNKARKGKVKTEVKKLVAVVQQGDLASAEAQLKSVTKRLDQTAAKGTLHKRTAARKKSRLARRLNAAKASNSG